MYLTASYNGSSHFELIQTTKLDWITGRKTRLPERALQIGVENRGGLKGSMQHWLAVYPPEFQIPMFFVAVD